MSILTGRECSRSPLTGAETPTAHGYLPPRPAPRALTELTALIGLLTSARSRVETVPVGHGDLETGR